LIVTVHFVGNQFVAYDPDGNQIKDRAILEQLQFEPFTGVKQTLTVEVDTSNIDAIIQPLDVNISITPK